MNYFIINLPVRPACSDADFTPMTMCGISRGTNRVAVLRDQFALLKQVQERADAAGLERADPEVIEVSAEEYYLYVSEHGAGEAA